MAAAQYMKKEVPRAIIHRIVDKNFPPSAADRVVIVDMQRLCARHKLPAALTKAIVEHAVERHRKNRAKHANAAPVRARYGSYKRRKQLKPTRGHSAGDHGAEHGHPGKHEWEPWLTLSQIAPFEDVAKKMGVSKVARSMRGFLPQYKRVGGDFDKLSDYWWGRRQDFVSRHMKQAKVRHEAFLKTGELSPRHLALIMWAYSPVPKLAQRALRQVHERF